MNYVLIELGSFNQTGHFLPVWWHLRYAVDAVDVTDSDRHLKGLILSILSGFIIESGSFITAAWHVLRFRMGPPRKVAVNIRQGVVHQVWRLGWGAKTPPPLA